MTETVAKWAERVAGWRKSGKTAEEYAAEFDFAASTLRYWASRLKSEGKTKSDDVAPKMAASMAIARVIRRQPAAVAAQANSESPGIELIVGGIRIVVRRGFDPEALCEVVSALGGSR